MYIEKIIDLDLCRIIIRQQTRRLESNEPYLTNDNQRQIPGKQRSILPPFRGCSFTCCIFHGLSNIGIDTLGSSSSAILHLPSINYASRYRNPTTVHSINKQRIWKQCKQTGIEGFSAIDDEFDLSIDSRRSERFEWILETKRDDEWMNFFIAIIGLFAIELLFDIDI